MKHRLGNSIIVAVGVLGAALAGGACALTAKSEVVDVRHFSPERAAPRSRNAASWGTPRSAAPSAPLEVRLGRVSSGRNLRERIAYRAVGYELGYYEDLRWTERPEVFVRRALGRSLFEVHELRRAVNGAAPTLDVEVLAFDELRLKKGRAALVELNIVLYDDSGVLFEDTLSVQRQAADKRPEIEGVVAALADALDAAVEEVARRVHQALSERLGASPVRAPPPP